MPTHGPGHLRTFDYLGLHRYFLTFCCAEKKAAFRETTAVQLTLTQLRRAADLEAFAVVVYCFMPDHVHLLVEAVAEHSNGLRFIARFKQFSGFYYKQRYKRTLWQRYGYERVLRGNEATLHVARYILANPVRAGIVQRPEDYEFSGSEKYSIAEILEYTSD
jgi:REP element-mobilizing transposase RayT